MPRRPPHPPSANSGSPDTNNTIAWRNERPQHHGGPGADRAAMMRGYFLMLADQGMAMVNVLDGPLTFPFASTLLTT